MCDFRKVTAVIVDGKQKPVEHKGYACSFKETDLPEILEEGIYSIGMSGVGQYYYDGQNWLSEYRGEVKFVCSDEHIGCIDFDPFDVENWTIVDMD